VPHGIIDKLTESGRRLTPGLTSSPAATEASRRWLNCPSTGTTRTHRRGSSIAEAIYDTLTPAAFMLRNILETPPWYNTAYTTTLHPEITRPAATVLELIQTMGAETMNNTESEVRELEVGDGLEVANAIVC